MEEVAELSLNIYILFHKYYVCINYIKLSNIKKGPIPLNKSPT